ncbi:coiled-coil domain-containing protein 39 isoform X2 [Petromyzon marinus]|uniref:coiled-coil domain-containing protein 39 isoform X2 n=1 Tax=Petromyzon marinus TaxID=7757 RepID=UPI003F6E8EE6
MSESVLAELQWDEGMAIPVANEENKALEMQLQKRLQENVSMEGEMMEQEERLHAMVEHLKNVKQEFTNTQVLCRAREKELETESHFATLAEREGGRLKQELRRLDAEMHDARERQNNHQNELFRATRRLEDKRAELRWDKLALDTWLEEAARRDEDIEALQRYARLDEGKIRELMLRLDRLTDEESQKRRYLENEVTETVMTQVELDKAAEEFRRAHRERQQLLQQWEETIQQMQRRDRDVERCALELAEARQEQRGRKELLRQKREFLEREVENNAEHARRTAGSERLAQKLRRALLQMDGARQQLHDQLETLKGTVERTATELENARAQVSNLGKEVQDKTNRLRALEGERESLRERLKSSQETALSAEERALRMDEMFAQEQQRIKELEQTLAQVKNQKFAREQQLQEGRVRERQAEVAMAGVRASIAGLRSRLQRLDADAIKQSNIIYSQDFQLAQLERRLAQLQGDISNEEKEQLEAQVAKLKAQLSERNDTHALLTAQLRRVQDDIRHTRRDLEHSSAEKAELTSKIEQLDLENNSAEKEMKKITNAKQELLVEESLLKLECRRVRGLVAASADGVLSLEKRQQALQTALKERSLENDARKHELLTLERGLQQERQALSAELHERLSKVDRMRKRYEILTVAMAPPEGEEDKSQAYYVIKAAQEKEEMQKEGDELDARIRRAEKEIRAMENTVQVVNGRNAALRRSHSKVPQGGAEHEERLRLEEQKRSLEEKLKFKRRQVRELQQDLQVMNESMDELLSEGDVQEGDLKGHSDSVQQLKKEIREQQEKIERGKKQCSRLSRELRAAAKSREATPAERDVALRELRDFGRAVTRLLSDILGQSPEVAGDVHVFFQQAGITLPSPSSSTSSSSSSSRQSSRLSSARSSASSVRGVGSQRASPGAAVTTVQLGLELPPPSPSSPHGGTPAGRSPGPTGSAAPSGRGSVAESTKGSAKSSRPSSRESQRSTRR